MKPLLSSSLISLLMNFWYLSGMGYGLCAVGSFTHLYMILLQWNQICFVTAKKAYLEFPEEPEHPLALLLACCDYLVQSESFTAVV